MKHGNNPVSGRTVPAHDSSSRLLSEQVFWTLLERERALVDRSERCYALLVFETPTGVDQATKRPKLIEAVCERVRTSDAVGWMGHGRLGALLAESDERQARSVAESIFASVGHAGDCPSCEIYVYPARLPRRPEQATSEDWNATLPTGGAGSIHVASLPQAHALMASPIPRWKRVLDVSIACTALVLLAPLLLALAAYIRWVSPGPVLFAQQRIGWGCRPFTCLKFRTMHVNADTTVHEQHVSSLIAHAHTPMRKLESGTDHRLIPLARFVRATGLDELPQLINVLRGEMSVVGPRPCMAYEFESLAPWQRRRFDTLPGLTGLWQVNGKNRTSFLQMMRYDISYAAKLSIGRDGHIIWRTLPAMIGQVRSLQTKTGSQS